MDNPVLRFQDHTKFLKPESSPSQVGQMTPRMGFFRQGAQRLADDIIGHGALIEKGMIALPSRPGGILTKGRRLVVLADKLHQFIKTAEEGHLLIREDTVETCLPLHEDKLAVADHLCKTV